MRNKYQKEMRAAGKVPVTYYVRKKLRKKVIARARFRNVSPSVYVDKVLWDRLKDVPDEGEEKKKR